LKYAADMDAEFGSGGLAGGVDKVANALDGVTKILSRP
jgi:hypothetical protein